LGLNHAGLFFSPTLFSQIRPQSLCAISTTRKTAATMKNSMCEGTVVFQTRRMTYAMKTIFAGENNVAGSLPNSFMDTSVQRVNYRMDKENSEEQSAQKQYPDAAAHGSANNKRRQTI
jgi:hypothetical protein